MQYAPINNLSEKGETAPGEVLRWCQNSGVSQAATSIGWDIGSNMSFLAGGGESFGGGGGSGGGDGVGRMSGGPSGGGEIR